MGAPLLDGAMAGFNMMERHKARIGNENRLSRLDEQNESRYQDSQARLSDMDKQKADQYQDTVDYRKETAKNTADYRKKTTENTANYRNWQQNKQDKATTWAQDQQLIGVGWDYFRSNGQISPEHEEMFQRNPGYDPRTFQNPEMRNNIKALSQKMEGVVKTGKMSEVNNPENIQLFNSVFKDKFSSSIGTADPVSGKVIKDVNFAGFVPTEDKSHSVSFALNITYEDGSTEIKPRTQGGTTEQDDPVLTMKPDELIASIQAKSMMADMIERPEYWDKMGNSVGDSLNKRRQQSYRQTPEEKNKTSLEKEYRSEKSSLEKELRKAKSTVSEKMLEGDEATKYLQPIHDAIANLDKQYGVTQEEPVETKTTKYKSTLKGHDVDSVIKRFMSANKSMTEEQALSAAMNQGYISE